MTLDKKNIKSWIVKNIAIASSTLSKSLSESFSVSRSTAGRIIKELVNEGFLSSTGGTRPKYSVRKLFFSAKYSLKNLDESDVWLRDIDPILNTLVKKNVYDILNYAFTEMLNNAIDHSEGLEVDVMFFEHEEEIMFNIKDNGIGIFKKITDALNLADNRLSLLELSKGKFTTDPSRHSGQGIFFVSRMADHFLIQANNLDYSHSDILPYDFLISREDEKMGTSVMFGIDWDSKKNPREVFENFTTDLGEFSFDKTVVPLRLAKIGVNELISRSQAKRVLARIDGFRVVMLDFEGVDMIGQAFSDEIFRVFKNTHPQVNIVAINTNQFIDRMIKRTQQD